MEKSSSDIRNELSEALKAIETLERVYPGFKLVLPSASESQAPEKKRPARKVNGAPIRDRVTSVASGRPKSLAEIVDATGLDKKQVRGCLNAPDMKDKFERTELDDGSKLYQYIEE